MKLWTPPRQKRRARDWLREPAAPAAYAEPALKSIQSIAAQSGHTLASLANKSGVSRSTLRNWFSGKTMRPQLPTVKVVLKGLGYSVTFTKD